MAYFDLIFDLHQPSDSMTKSTFLCESLSFKRSDNFQHILTDYIIESIDNALARSINHLQLGQLHLVDMAAYSNRPSYEPNNNGYYKALESFARLRCKYPKFSYGVTLCGKINYLNLIQEIILFKYWFGNDLTISLSSDLWSDNLFKTLSLLKKLDIRVQFMLNITRERSVLGVKTPKNFRNFEQITTHITKVTDSFDAPVSVHFCSVETAGWLNINRELLDIISTFAPQFVSGDVIYSGGLKLERDLLLQITHAYPAVTRWCIGNEFLRLPVDQSLERLNKVTNEIKAKNMVRVRRL